MTCADIKALPKEFDFKSNINPCGLTYHAVEKEYYYIVTTDGCEWKIDKSEIRRNLLKGNYYLVDEEKPILAYVVICTVGISSGYKKLIGIYSTLGKAEAAKRADAKKNVLAEWHYSIESIKVDEIINKTYVEW